MEEKYSRYFLNRRSDAEMMELILTTARQDDRIRAVILNGSRVNPNIQPDRYQDFDVVYLVTEVAPFVDDPTWMDRFGERMILQTPDRMGDEKPRKDGGFTYLIQFMDGHRIDLNLIPIRSIGDMEPDSLSVLLLDKDNRVQPFPPPSEASYLPSPPTEKAFADCCNEFWWVAPYVAKALARGEILYAKHLLDVILRGELMKMLTWQFGIKTNFKRNPGKYGQHFREVFTNTHWDKLLNTYTSIDFHNSWDSLFKMTDLFHESTSIVARATNFQYQSKERKHVSSFLHFIYKDTMKNN